MQLGESAQFFCKADGDPMPSVEWSREQGPLPNGRSEEYREHWVLLTIDLYCTFSDYRNIMYTYAIELNRIEHSFNAMMFTHKNFTLVLVFLFQVACFKNYCHLKILILFGSIKG